MRFIMFIAFLLLVCIGMIPKVTHAAGGASPILNLEGPRNLTYWEPGNVPPEYWISTEEYAYVQHGWSSTNQYESKMYWSELVGVEKAEFIRTSTYDLFIDGNQIKLNRAQWYNRELDTSFIIYYTQFKPGDLAPGDYQFTGTWYSEVYGEPRIGIHGQCPISLTVTVHIV